MSGEPGPPAEVLAAWGLVDAAVTVEQIGAGLINATFAVTDVGGAKMILQRVNPIFAPEIHRNIAAVTAALARAGVATPQLIPSVDGGLWHADQGAIWRMQEAIDGVSFNALVSPAQARAAARFVGRWHAALADLDHEFVGLRAGVHDTPTHLAKLERAVAEGGGHRLFGPVEGLARALLDAAAGLENLPACPLWVAHGDLKINNLLFAGTDEVGRLEPVALIDLDTVGPMSLAYELGDMWRSWSNRATEDEPQARVDLDLFEASWSGWVEGLGREIDGRERRALVLGPEWISLELAARFCADAIFEDYFGWDRARFAGRGEHNLARARSQWSLHRVLVASRAERAAVLGV